MDKTPLKTRAWEFWRRNQVLLLQLPVMVIFLFATYIVLKAIDPRIGVEGFGDIFGYLLNGVRVTLIIFTAWWIKKWCWFDLHDKTELEMFKMMRGENVTLQQALLCHWIVVRDRVEWVAALAFATFWYTR